MIELLQALAVSAIAVMWFFVCYLVARCVVN